MALDPNSVRQMAKEFGTATGHAGEAEVSLLQRSDRFGGLREVWRLAFDGAGFVLKYDRSGASKLSFAEEFHLCERLYPYFERSDKQRMPRPCYVALNEAWAVWEDVGNRLSETVIAADKNPRAVGQIYRRAGAWLRHLHGFEATKPTKLRPDWMLAEIDAACAAGPAASGADFGKFRRAFEADCAQWDGSRQPRGFSHGDFHAGNVILGDGVLYGIDVSQAGPKCALYDIVDFLKSDWMRASVDVGAGTVSDEARDMFLKGYGASVDRAALAFCLRGRLLIDWLTITSAQAGRSAHVRAREARLSGRAKIAFAAV